MRRRHLAVLQRLLAAAASTLPGGASGAAASNVRDVAMHTAMEVGLVREANCLLAGGYPLSAPATVTLMLHAIRHGQRSLLAWLVDQHFDYVRRTATRPAAAAAVAFISQFAGAGSASHGSTNANTTNSSTGSAPSSSSASGSRAAAFRTAVQRLGGSLLRAAARHATDARTLRWLMREPCELDVDLGQGSAGGTALHAAASVGNVEAARWLVLRGGANVHSLDVKKRTPLHCACSRGDPHMIQLLVALGARLDLGDSRNTTPTGLALLRSDAATAAYVRTVCVRKTERGKGRLRGVGESFELDVVAKIGRFWLWREFNC